MTRAAFLLATALATIGIGYPALAPRPIRLVWNASASAPIGLYLIDPGGSFGLRDLVAVNAPDSLATFLAERGYLSKGTPLLKHIRGVAGQTVCRTGPAVTVDGVEVGAALERDRAGRDLPAWQGCHRISADEVFLLNGQVRDSLDGRYFGPTSINRIIGRAVPLWSDEVGDGRFTWHAATR